MNDRSRIEWTDATWNPVRGCDKVSPGYAPRYAETFAERFRGVPGHPYELGFDPRLVPHKLIDPRRWPSHRMIFVNSMSDLFHEKVPDGYIRLVTDVMLTANWHTYQVLTKRSSRMKESLLTRFRDAANAPHIWWGVSVEDRKHGVPRIDQLRQAPVQTRFLSVERFSGSRSRRPSGIHWVRVGGESGVVPRPIDPDWARSIRDQCREAGIPFFFKQWGGVRKGQRGRDLDGQTYDEFPKISSQSAPDSTSRLKLTDSVAHVIQEIVPELTGANGHGEAASRRRSDSEVRGGLD